MNQEWITQNEWSEDHYEKHGEIEVSSDYGLSGDATVDICCPECGMHLVGDFWGKNEKLFVNRLGDGSCQERYGDD
tara:strand:- start:82 stop:309 length:228 start_codon:yes stop_codon:yes gene_type:complete